MFDVLLAKAWQAIKALMNTIEHTCITLISAIKWTQNLHIMDMHKGE